MPAAPLRGEEGGCPKISLKSTKRKDEREKRLDYFFTSKNESLMDVLVPGKKVDKMKEKKNSSKEESPIPMLVLMALILLGGVLLAGFIIFSE
jgi:hypothetical protein